MEEELEYNGKTYFKSKGKWYDKSTYCETTIVIQNELNKQLSDSINYSNMHFQNIIRIADGFKNSNSYTMAINTYEKALEKTQRKEDYIYILPRITSCYRKNNQPQKAIELYTKICKIHGYDLLNEVLLTSIAAAYCDLEEYDNAKKCADRAYAILDGKCTYELTLVYKRINKNLD